MSYRDDLQALSDRHSALTADVRRTVAKRDDARRLLDNAKARLRLPVLDNIRVAAPCKEDWAGMQGDARVRHCLRCDQNVYNLSDMTRDEAESLILAKEGKLCVRYFRRKQDGTILVKKDCPVGAQRRKRWWVGLGIVGTIVGAVLGLVSKKNSAAKLLQDDETVPFDHEAIAGGIGMEPDHMTPPVNSPYEPLKTE
jgi:hypothetical protein